MSISDRVQKSMEQRSWIRRMFEEGAILKQQYDRSILHKKAEVNRCKDTA